MRGEPEMVKQLIRKAKDSALLAIEFYNKPAVSFKSEGFITMMCIAWTSLFHAYFFKNGVKPYYKKNTKRRIRYEKITETLSDGKKIKNYKWWELSKCIEEYYKGDANNAVSKNLLFFSGIRNTIVHRNLPEVDPNLYAECKANILNFNSFLKDNFGDKNSIDYMLSYAIQMFKSNKNFLEATKAELKKKGATEVVEFIKSFRSSLTSDIFESPEYAYKAVLIQVKNHKSKDALAIQFKNEDDLTDEQKEQLKDMGVVLIKEKENKVIVDDVPPEFELDFNSLIIELRKAISNFKQNKKFYKFRYEALEEHPELVHIRKLDNKNPKSTFKKFYRKELVEIIKDKYKQ